MLYINWWLDENEFKGQFIQGRIKRIGAGFSVQPGSIWNLN